LFFFFFFQAEDGIRDIGVTGVRRVLFRSLRLISFLVYIDFIDFCISFK